MTYQAPFSVLDIQSAVMQGREAERERIIALLEAECVCEPMRGDKNNCGFCDTVSLIKGEN